MSNYALSLRRDGYWYGNGQYKGSSIKPNNGVIHTTEGTSLPGYGGGASAPHYTGIPDLRNRKITWIAHFPDEQSARALRNESGGVQTNTLNCIQIELVGTCDLATSNRWGNVPHIFWPKAPDWALREVAKFVADMNKRHGIPIKDSGKPWVAYPKSYGTGASQRLSNAQWTNHKGWCGHQHVPENSHGDPGNINWDLIAKYAKEIVNPVEESPVQKVRAHINSALVIVNDIIAKSDKSHPRLSAARIALRTAKRALRVEKVK